MNTIRTLVAGTALALLSVAGFAQSTPAPAPDKLATPRVDRREIRQDKRIDQGVASGQLTAHETKRLDREQTAIDKAETHAKADGNVTAKERAHLTRMQNRASRDIHRQKHDAQVAKKS